MFELPEDFHVNSLKALHEGYQEDFERDLDPNKLGWSELGYGARKLVLKKIHKIKKEANLIMLMGKIMHFAVQRKAVISNILLQVFEQCDVRPKNFKVIKEEFIEHKMGEKTIEGHIDISTSLFPIEWKFPWTYNAYWNEEVLPYHGIQLNGYMGIKKQLFGFLGVVNMRAFLNQFKTFEKSSRKWSYFVKLDFDQLLFNASINKAETIFEAIDCVNIDLPCPEHEWECKYCPVLKQCGKIEYKCQHKEKKGEKWVKCNKSMYEWDSCLTKQWLESPICQNCYENKTPKRKPYDSIKYAREFPWS